MFDHPTPVLDLERIEAAATVDWLRTFEGATEHEGRLAQVAGLTCSSVLGAPAFLFNRVFAAGLERPLDDAALDGLEAHYRAVGVPFRIGIAPGARPADLAGQLKARGYVRGMDWMRFSRPAGEAPPVRCDLPVRRLDGREAGDFARVASAAFDMPSWLQPHLARLPGRAGWSVYGAFDGAELVAVGALFVEGPLGWIGFAGTLPVARGRGAQKALIAARLVGAAEQGVREVTVETGVRCPGDPSPSYDNIVAMGFAERYVRSHFDSPVAPVACD